MATIEELKAKLPDIEWESAYIGNSPYVGTAMCDGIMYWTRADQPIDAIVQQVQLMHGKGMLKTPVAPIYRKSV